MTGFEFDWLGGQRAATGANFRLFTSDYARPARRYDLRLAHALRASLAAQRRRRVGPRAHQKRARRGGPDDQNPWRIGVRVFTVAAPLPANLWRELARAAGAHVWCESNEVLMASEGIVALHSLKVGRKTVLLPRPMHVFDLVDARDCGRTTRIEFDLDAPGTKVFRLQS